MPRSQSPVQLEFTGGAGTSSEATKSPSPSFQRSVSQPASRDQARSSALAAGDPSYRTVKGILAAGTERAQQATAAAAGDGGAAAFLRGPASFANVIPLPGTVTSDAVHPAATREATS